MGNRFARLNAADITGGKWVTICRVGSYPQIDLTSDKLDQIVESYDPEFETAVVNFDHAKKGPAHAKISAVRRAGDYLQAKFCDVSQELKDGVESGKWFRPSAEIYPAHPAHPRKAPYLRGAAIMGNGSVQVRGLPKVEFSAKGRTYVGLKDDRGAYVLLDAADWRKRMRTRTSDAGGRPANLAGRVKRKIASLADKSEQEFKTLKDANATKDAEIAKLKAQLDTNTSTIKQLADQREQERLANFEAKIDSDLRELVRDARLTPGERDVWKPILASLGAAENVIKLGAGEKAREFKGPVKAALHALSLRPRILRDGLGEHMGAPDVDDAAPSDQNEIWLKADAMTEKAIKSGEVKMGPESAAYLEKCVNELTVKFNAARFS